MGKQNPITSSFSLPDGRVVTLETGKLATQADGSVMLRMGKTLILATVVAAKEPKPNQDFFPLSVDYQEKFAAAGRIPGNFFRREGRLSDYEVLVSRLVDRAIRPLFPDEYLCDTQIMVTLLSGEKEVLGDSLAALAASAALTLSDVPFQGPISEVRVAKINGEFKINPPRSEFAEAELNVIVGATIHDVTMVEGESKECSEADLIQAIKIGHEAIKVQIQAQLELAALAGKAKRELVPLPQNEDLKKEIETFCSKRIYDIARAFSDKKVRRDAFKEVYTDLKAALLENHGEEFMTANASLIGPYYDKTKKHVIRMMILDDAVRLDGRKYDQIRPIWCEVDFLPSTHGSSIFNRGETQALASVSLGTKLDEVMNDTAMLVSFEKFFLHYNFPGFSVGEVKPNRGPGRREVGHANLAARSLKQVLPVGSPYTIRIVSDILESNGSSSMATVCSGSMALMDAGIQIRSHVAGIAMGMITDGGRFAILSDILGDEDALGDMDFKVTGTEKGITGCQMDIKIDGLPYDKLEQALEQARVGRLHIIEKMKEEIPVPNPDLKPHAPRIVEVIIERSYIGAVIGPGGSVVQDIQRTTNTVVTITEVDDKGVINISSPDKASIDAALDRINAITHVPEVGNVYEGVIKTIQPYGAFVDFMGKSGLLHVSEMSYSRIDRVEDHFKEGDKIKVKLMDIDVKTGKYRLSLKALLPPPAGREGQDGGNGENRPPRNTGGGHGHGGGDRNRR